MPFARPASARRGGRPSGPHGGRPTPGVRVAEATQGLRIEGFEAAREVLRSGASARPPSRPNSWSASPVAACMRPSGSRRASSTRSSAAPLRGSSRRGWSPRAADIIGLTSSPRAAMASRLNRFCRRCRRTGSRLGSFLAGQHHMLMFDLFDVRPAVRARRRKPEGTSFPT